MIQLALGMYTALKYVQVKLNGYFHYYPIRLISFEVGIYTGCTIFLMLLVKVINIILNAIEATASSAIFGDECYMSPLIEFMDDSTVH